MFDAADVLEMHAYIHPIIRMFGGIVFTRVPVVVLQIQQEMNTAFVQEFYQTVRDTCFKACVTKPGTSLSSSEQQCLARCCDRYNEATQIVTKSTLEMSGIE